MCGRYKLSRRVSIIEECFAVSRNNRRVIICVGGRPMVDWVGAESTGVPHALALALRGKSPREIAHETGIAESSLLEEDMSASWAGVDKHILDALALALKRKSIREIVRETGVPASSLYSIRKHGPYEHRNRQKF